MQHFIGKCAILTCKLIAFCVYYLKLATFIWVIAFGVSVCDTPHVITQVWIPFCCRIKLQGWLWALVWPLLLSTLIHLILAVISWKWTSFGIDFEHPQIVPLFILYPLNKTNKILHGCCLFWMMHKTTETTQPTRGPLYDTIAWPLQPLSLQTLRQMNCSVKSTVSCAKR